MINIADAAESMIGVKFKHRGRSLAGVDCLGLVVLAINQSGYSCDDNQHYSRTPSQKELLSELNRQFDRVKLNDVARGDILLMRHEGRLQHLAIYCGDSMAIHSTPRLGKVSKMRISGAMVGVNSAYRIKK